MSYRLWRDVGLRGYGPDGLASRRFRGRWAARNAAFADLMVRTGMRLSEQAHLTRLEVPTGPGAGGYQRFWLPGAIAKYFSARWIYVPYSVVRELAAYAELDRAEVVEDARAAGVYRRWRRPLVIDDPSRPQLDRVTGSGIRRVVNLAELTAGERGQLLVEGAEGLEPALFWLGENGQPLAVSTWKSMFADANKRCQARGVALSCHAHLLRHSFAVVTLEQLQRGHIAALGEFNEGQRGHYTRIFGDPLDWAPGAPWPGTSPADPAASSPEPPPSATTASKSSKATPAPATPDSAPKSKANKPSSAANTSWPPSTPTNTPH